MEQKPITTPIQKFPPNADALGRPYWPHFRCSILAIKRAAIAVITRRPPSLIAAIAGVSETGWE